mgnify:FL=1
MLDFHFLENKAQTDAFTKNDFVEGEKTIVKKFWMDTKKKSSPAEMAQASKRALQEISEFKPDLVFVGDDNATERIGGSLLDTPTPVVSWGVNVTPLKYGLLNSLETPGHNVTGVYQPGYPIESLTNLKKLAPSAKTFAILSDNSETGRAKAKEIERMAAENRLPLTLVGSIITNSYAEWKAGVLKYRDRVDAFSVMNHSTLKDDNGTPVDQMEAGSWYLQNSKKPDCSFEKQFAQEGILLAADDSGYKQGYESVKLAHQILVESKNPAMIPVYAPERGKIMVNRERAAMLGIDLSGHDFIEEFIDKSLALQKFPASTGKKSNKRFL